LSEEEERRGEGEGGRVVLRMDLGAEFHWLTMDPRVEMAFFT